MEAMKTGMDMSKPEVEPMKSEMEPKLYKAAAKGNVDFLIENPWPDLYLNKRTHLNNTLLHIAVKFQKLDFATNIIQLCPSLLQSTNKFGDTPLHIAAKSGSLKIAELLIKSAKKYQSDIETSAGDGDKELLRMANNEKDTALHVAVRNGHADVVDLLLAEDLQLSTLVNSAGESAVFLAVEGGFLDMACHILRRNRSSDCGGRHGMTALHAAVIRTYREREEKDIVQDLSLEKLRRVICSRLFRLRFLAVTCNTTDSENRDDILNKLLEVNPKMARIANEYGWTPLHYAAHLGHIYATTFLLEHDTSVAYLTNKEGISALHIAAKEGHLDVFEELIRFHPDMCDLLDIKGWTPLHVAINSKKITIVNYILENKDLEGLINVPDNQGNTPLHVAAIRTHIYSLLFWYGKTYNILMTLAFDPRIDIKAVNKEHLKAIDIIQSNMDIGELMKFRIIKKMEEIGSRRSLHRVISENTELQESNITNDTTNEEHYNISENLLTKRSSSLSTDLNALLPNKETKLNRLKDISQIHLLVATLIATVTFTAGFTVPGGYKNSGSDEGMAVLTSNKAFRTFMVADGLAFYCSTASVLLHFFASAEDNNYHLFLRFMKFAAALTYFSILAIAVAFSSGMYSILPHSSDISIAVLVFACSFFTFYMFGFM